MLCWSGTIRENLLLGNDDVTEEELVAVAKAAVAHAFIRSLSDGYDSDVGGEGSLVSERVPL